MRFAAILTKLIMKFSTLAALMATTTAVKIDQSTAAKTTSTLASKIRAKTTEAEPQYEITGIMKMVGNSTAAHEGPDMNDELAEADADNNAISAASPHNPLAWVEMLDQKFRVGGQLDIMLNPGRADYFYIDLLVDYDHWLYFEMEDHGDGHSCLYISEERKDSYDHMEYCVKKDLEDQTGFADLFEAGPELQVQFLEDGANLRFWGHLINEDMSDVFDIGGTLPAGKNTWNHAINWENYNMVDIYHAGGEHIIEAAME